MSGTRKKGKVKRPPVDAKELSLRDDPVRPYKEWIKDPLWLLPVACDLLMGNPPGECYRWPLVLEFAQSKELPRMMPGEWPRSYYTTKDTPGHVQWRGTSTDAFAAIYAGDLKAIPVEDDLSQMGLGGALYLVKPTDFMRWAKQWAGLNDHRIPEELTLSLAGTDEHQIPQPGNREVRNLPADQPLIPWRKVAIRFQQGRQEAEVTAGDRVELVSKKSLGTSERGWAVLSLLADNCHQLPTGQGESVRRGVSELRRALIKWGRQRGIGEKNPIPRDPKHTRWVSEFICSPPPIE